jgi:hypothetical protein
VTWITPMYAAIAAAIAVPTLIILYFLKLRRRDLEISTTLLWKKSIQDLQANAPFQKLRRNLLLFLQLLALAGLIGALGQLTMKGQNVVGTKHVILIDRSGSMAALDETDGRNPRTRLDEAKLQAIALVESLGEGNVFNKSNADEAMVIAFAGNGEVRQQFTSDKVSLKNAIEAITLTDGPTSIEEAMRLAIAHKPKRNIVENVGLEAGIPVTMHIYSDGRLPDADKGRPGVEDTVVYHHIGKPESFNVGVVGLRAERSYDDPNKLSIFVALQNNSPTDRTVDIEMLIDGTVAAIKPARIPGATGGELSAAAAAQAEAREREAANTLGAPAPKADPKPESETAVPLARPGVGGVVFQLERGSGALVQVRTRSTGSSDPVEGDVLPNDDRAWLVVPPARKMAVAVVGRPELFISTALAGLPLSRLENKTPAEFEQLVRDGRLGEYDVVILNGWVPTPTPPVGTAAAPTAAAPAAPAAPETNPATPAAPQGTVAQVLPPGRYLILGGVPAGMGITDKGKSGSASVVDWNRDHPALRVANLHSVQIATSRLVEVQRELGAETIASADNGPMVIEAASGDVRALVVPFDIADSDWPFKPSFVLFLASSIGYLGEDGMGGGARMLVPGRELSDRIPIGATNVTLKGPGGNTQSLTPASDGRIIFGPIESTGVYDVTWDGPAGPIDLVGTSNRVLRTYAANLLDPNESDLAAATTNALATAEVASERREAAQADKKLWPWFILAALAIVMFEWFIYNRKVYL